jgi:hypothetical protein
MPPICCNAGIVVEIESKLNRLILPGCTRQRLPHEPVPPPHFIFRCPSPFRKLLTVQLPPRTCQPYVRLPIIGESSAIVLVVLQCA